MNSSTRKVRCLKCNCIQPMDEALCKNCGEDLMLYGEILREAAPTAGSTASGVKAAARTGGLLGNKLAVRIIATLLSVSAVGGIVGGVIGGSRKTPSTDPATPSTATTDPTTVTAPTNPAAGPTAPTTPAVPTEPATNPAAPTTPTTGSVGTVIAPVDLSYFNQIPENAVPDMYYWADGRVTYATEPNENNNGVYYYDAAEDVVDKYIDMLQNNGFTLVDTYYFSYKGSSFGSWGFTCDAVPGAEKIKLQYMDTRCHVSLYYADKPGEYRMDISPDLLVCDTGLRYDGSVVDLRPSGASAGAGLELLANGSYRTTDGRLTASVGTAMILRDGVTYTANASYAVEGGDEVLRVRDYYRDEGIYFQAQKASLAEGDVFTQRDMRRWRWTQRNEMDDLDGQVWGNIPLLVMPQNDQWQGVSFNEKWYESQTVRVMLYDTGNIGVFYFHAKFLKGEPREVEALCVVSMADRSGTIDDATYVKAGNVATVKYGHHEQDTMWETYDWVILEGADKISISAVGNTCDVTANKPGVAAVQVTYGYSKEEPDPLTGISRTVSRSKIQVYYFIIE